MRIVGLDVSITSTGVVVFDLDDNLDVVDKTFFGFVTKKYQDKDTHLHYYKNDQFPNYIERTKALQNKIFDVIGDCVDYASIEDYAFSGTGKTFHIGEFTGKLKERLYDNGASIRLTDPTSLKKFATGNGNSGKTEMGLEAPEHPDWSRDGFPVLLEDSKVYPFAKSPSADIIDAWWLAKLLQLELKLRRGLVNLRDYPEHVISTFNRVTKSNPINILDREFLCNGEMRSS